MTRDDIINLALEAGIKLEDEHVDEYSAFGDELERFAALVAAAEREACATIDVTPLNILASDGPGTAILKYRAAIRARGQS